MLRAAARYFERLRGKDEKAAGKERHEREHVQVHAIRPRQVRATFLHCVNRRDVRTGWQDRCDSRLHLRAIRPWREPQIDAVQLAKPRSEERRVGKGWRSG